MRVIDAETFSSQKYPLCEAYYAMDDTNPLDLYDCLIPNIKEYRRIYSDLYPHKYREDTKY